MKHIDESGNASEIHQAEVQSVKGDTQSHLAKINSFIGLIEQLRKVMEGAKTTPIKHSLKQLDQLLNALYDAGSKLPDGNPDYCKMATHAAHWEYLFAEDRDPLSSSPELEMLSENLIEILNDLEVYQEYMPIQDATNNWAGIICDWNISFLGASGWGKSILESLSIIHDLQERES